MIYNGEFLPAIEYYKALFQILLSLRKKKKRSQVPAQFHLLVKESLHIIQTPMLCFLGSYALSKRNYWLQKKAETN